MHRALLVITWAVATAFSPLTLAAEPALEVHIAPGVQVTSRQVGDPPMPLRECVEAAVQRWGGEVAAGTRRATTLVIPLGVDPMGTPRRRRASTTRIALPWGFVQDLVVCRAEGLLAELSDCDLPAGSFTQAPCSGPLEANIGLTVRADGTVKTARVGPYASPGPVIPGAACMERAVMRWRFPEFAGVAHQVGARVLLAPGAPCSDPYVAVQPDEGASAPPRASNWIVRLAVLVALGMATVIAVVLVKRRRGR